MHMALRKIVAAVQHRRYDADLVCQVIDFQANMSAFARERVLEVHHWNETLFSFKATRDPALRFENGHFVMVGLEIGGKPLMRAYSIASANY